MKSVNESLTRITDRLKQLKQAVGFRKQKQKVKELEFLSQSETLWQDQVKAQVVMKKLAGAKNEIKEIEELEIKIKQLNELASSVTKAEAETLKPEVKKLTKILKKLELKKYFSNEHDRSAAILSIHAGQGGTEAMDWTAMLKRMYLRFCERQDFKAVVINETVGEEAGTKSVTIAVDGLYAYGYLRHEKGTHRLVRQSPFNADNLRQTSFALVEVLPEIEETDEI